MNQFKLFIFLDFIMPLKVHKFPAGNQKRGFAALLILVNFTYLSVISCFIIRLNHRIT